jgi:drug/metabolite transporter (DMT)-like permease
LSTEVFTGLGPGPLFAFLSSCTWAVGSATYSRLSLRHSPFAINFSRALIALPLFLLGAVIVTPEGTGVLGALTSMSSEQIGWLTLSMICSYALGDAFFVWSTQSLGVPGALAVASSYPIWTALYGSVFRGETLSARGMIGLILALVGIISVILSAPHQSQEHSGHPGETKRGRSLLRGVSLAVLTSWMWALNSVSIAQAGSSLNVFQVNSVRMVLGLILCMGLGYLSHRSKRVVIKAGAHEWEKWLGFRAIRPFFWVFLLEAFGGSLFFTYGLSHSPLVVASTLSSLAPVIAVPVAWVLRLEKLNFVRSLSVLIVVFGLALLVTG